MNYTIDTDLIEKLEKKLKSFSNKFNKFGKDVLTYTKSEPYYSEEQESYVVDVEISGSYQIEGYEFIATFEWDEVSQCNLINRINREVEIPKQYRTSTKCDHCNTNRMRKKTVLLRNIETGEFVQVGKSCVKDYLGVNAEMYASYLSGFESIDTYIEGMLDMDLSLTKKRYYPVQNVLEQAVASVFKRGYVSQTKSSIVYYERGEYLETTADEIKDIVTKCRQSYDVTEEVKDYVSNVIEYVTNTEEDSDYFYNLKILFRGGYVNLGKVNLVVSSIGAYMKELIRIEKEQRIANNPSKHIGNIGDKFQFTATPTVAGRYETDFGITVIYKFIVDGNEVIWKTGSGSLEVDKEVTLKGTIKEHSTFNGIPQTALTRCRVCK